MMKAFENRTTLRRITSARQPHHFRSLSTTGNTEPIQDRFPWKSEPQERTFWEMCTTFYRVLNASFAYRRFTEQDEEAKMELHHTITGSMWALKTSIAAIFQHKSMQDHFDSLKTKNSLKIDGLLTPADIQSVNFREIFDEKLAEFYTKAIEKHCAQTKDMVVYSLLKVHGAQFVDLELMANLQRGGRMPKYDHFEVQDGVTMLLPPLRTDEDVDEHVEDVTEQYLTDDKNSTVRAKVLVHCSGKRLDCIPLGIVLCYVYSW